MNTEQAVHSSIGLLQRMSENPQAVLEVLDPAGRDRVMRELSVLAERSAGVEAEADLRHLTDEVHRLVEQTPALARLLLAETRDVSVAQDRPTTRKVTFEYHQPRSLYGREYRNTEHGKHRYQQEHAAEIRNHVLECRRKLETALRGYPLGR